MSEAILIALITGGLSFLGVLVSNISGNKKIVNDIKTELVKYQAVTDTKITELTREVREHNNFAKRMPVVENEIKNIKEKIIDLHKDTKL